MTINTADEAVRPVPPPRRNPWARIEKAAPLTPLELHELAERVERCDRVSTWDLWRLLSTARRGLVV